MKSVVLWWRYENEITTPLMEKLKAFAWFALKVTVAVLIIEIIDAKTGIVTRLKDAVRGVTG